MSRRTASTLARATATQTSTFNWPRCSAATSTPYLPLNLVSTNRIKSTSGILMSILD